MSGHITDHLIQDKLITYEQLKNAVGEQKRSGGTLEDALVALGYVSEFQIALYLGKVFGVPPADIDSVEIAEDILRLVSKELATENLLIPLYIEDSKLAVAMTDPTDILIIDDLGFVTGMDIHALVASERAIRGGIEKYYEQETGEAHPSEESLSEGESRREDEGVEAAQSEEDGAEPDVHFDELMGEPAFPQDANSQDTGPRDADSVSPAPGRPEHADADTADGGDTGDRAAFSYAQDDEGKGVFQTKTEELANAPAPPADYDEMPEMLDGPAQTSSAAPEPNASEQAPFKLLVGEQNKGIEGGEHPLPGDGVSNIVSSDEQQGSIGESMPPSRYSSTPFATPLPSTAHAPLAEPSLEEDGLSMANPETDEEVPYSPPALDEEKRSILIVDGSETAQRVLTVTLENRGYNVAVAGNAMEAMAKVEEVVPDLILVDVRLPYIDGYQLCKILRGNSPTKHVPIVMLSDRGGFFDKVKRRVVGAGDHIAKPFRPKELFEVVERYVGGND